MKKDESAVDRVGKLIKQTSKPVISKKKHAYVHEKTPPVPSGLENVAVKNSPPSKRRLKRAKVVPQKKSNISFEQVCCSANQSYSLFFIEKADVFYLRKVRNFRVKERLIAARNIKTLSNQMQKWIHSQVRQDIKILQNEAAEELENFIEKREERHFRIDRVIRYLSD